MHLSEHALIGPESNQILKAQRMCTKEHPVLLKHKCEFRDRDRGLGSKEQQTAPTIFYNLFIYEDKSVKKKSKLTLKIFAIKIKI